MRKLIFILVSILFISCASRKVQVDNTEIKTDSIVEKKDTIAMKTVDSIYIKNDITTNEITIQPLDTCKPFIVDGKVYKNVVIRIKNTKDNSLHTSKKTESLNASKTLRARIVKNKVTHIKKIDKTNILPWYLVLYVIFAIALFLVYKYLNIPNIIRTLFKT